MKSFGINLGILIDPRSAEDNTAFLKARGKKVAKESALFTKFGRKEVNRMSIETVIDCFGEDAARLVVLARRGHIIIPGVRT